MQKHFLRILHLGEHNFWKILHDLENITDEQCTSWQNSLTKTPIHLWLGPKKTPEREAFLSLLDELSLDIIKHDCAKHDVVALQEEADKYTEHALHITCGFSETALDVLCSCGGGVWFTGYSPVNTPWAALAELALIKECASTIDTYRVCVIGAVDGLSQSLMESAIYAPFELFMGVPPWGDPDQYQTGLALKSGAKIFMSREPQLALDGADLIYIDAFLVEMAEKKANEKIAMTPLTGLDNYVWQKGFKLSADYLDYAKPNAPILTLLDPKDANLVPEVDTKLSARRAYLRKNTLLATLAMTASGLE